MAATEEPQDAYDFLKRVSQHVSRAYADAIRDLAPSLPGSLAREVLLTMVAMTPVVGPVAERVAVVGEAVAETRAFNRSWIAALMKLGRA